MKVIYSFSTLNSQRTFIMGVAIISIMLFHQQWLDGFVFDFFRSVGHWGVDVFLFLSGYGIAQSLQKNTLRQYFNNRIKRMFPTCVFMGGVTIVSNLMVGRSLNLEFTALLCNLLCLNYWFIYAILVYYCIAPLLNTLPSKYSYIWALSVVFAIIVFKTVFLHSSFPYPLDWIIWRFPIFCIGFFLYKGSYEFGNIYYVLGSISLIAILLLVHFNVLLPGSELTYIVIIPFVILLTLVVGRIPQLMKNVILLYTKNVISLCGKMSLQLYLAHSLIFAIIQFYFPGYAGIRLFLISFATSFILSYSVYKLTEVFKSEHSSFNRQ